MRLYGYYYVRFGWYMWHVGKGINANNGFTPCGMNELGTCGPLFG